MITNNLKKKSYYFSLKKDFDLIIKRSFRYWGASSNLIWMFENKWMFDPIIYISMLLGLGGVYVLISSFDDDDDHHDDGERFFYNFEYTRLES